MPEIEDHLAHYGVPGMKWGKRKIAASKERAATIDGARARQAERKAEVRQLTAKRISERSEKGKAHLDRQIADKKFEIENNADAQVSKQMKNGEKVMKGVKIAAILGMSVVGLGAAASIINTEIARAEEREMPFPRTFREMEVAEKIRSGERVSVQEKAEAMFEGAKMRDKYKN